MAEKVSRSASFTHSENRNYLKANNQLLVLKIISHPQKLTVQYFIAVCN
jgi:hypothetical protein